MLITIELMGVLNQLTTGGATLYNIIFCVHTHISPANFDVASLFYPLVTSLESKLVTNFLSHPRLTGLREVDVPWNWTMIRCGPSPRLAQDQLLTWLCWNAINEIHPSVLGSSSCDRNCMEIARCLPWSYSETTTPPERGPASRSIQSAT